MRFAIGILFIGVVIGLSEAATAAVSGGSSSSVVKEFCSKKSDVKACKNTAGKCYFRHLTGSSAAECKCKDSVKGVSSIYQTWVHTQNADNDKCSKGPEVEFPEVHKGPGGEKPVSFNDYLTSQNADLASQFKCCFGKEVGLFDAKGAPITAVWKEKASKITDAAAKTAVNSAIDKCATSVKTCSPRAFMDCVVQGCYGAVVGA